MACRAAQEHTGKTGNIKPPYFGEHIQDIVFIRLVSLNGSADHIDLPHKPLGTQPGAAPGHFFHIFSKQNRHHSTARSCISNAHLTGSQNIVPFPRQFRGDSESDKNRLFRLLSCHRRTFEHIIRSIHHLVFRLRHSGNI